jgi:hypothetical protein
MVGGGDRSETIHAYVTSKKITDLRKSIALFALEFYKHSRALPVNFLQLIYNSSLKVYHPRCVVNWCKEGDTVNNTTRSFLIDLILEIKT